MSTHTQEYACHIVWLLLMLCAQMTHYPPLSTLELYDSDPRIDLDGLLSLVDLFGCFLLVCNTVKTDAKSKNSFAYQWEVLSKTRKTAAPRSRFSRVADLASPSTHIYSC